MTVDPTLAAIVLVSLALAAYGYWLDGRRVRAVLALSALIAGLALAASKTLT